ncbi:hypothetical protein RCL1_003919 [Eukaryota sp. TZLM3-RCL]
MQTESHFLFIGMASSGKSTLRKLLSASSSEIKPSVGVDYSFRKISSHGTSTISSAHFWEVAVSPNNLVNTELLVSLLSTIISPVILPCLHVIISLNLDQHPDLFFYAVRLVHAVKTAIAKIAPLVAPEIGREFARRCTLGPSHWYNSSENIKGQDYIGIPIFIVANKFLNFDDVTFDRRRALVRSLRYLCHSEGCSLAFCDLEAQKQVPSTAKLLSVLKALCMGAPPKVHNPVFDDVQPVLVFAGQDDLNQIGKVPDVNRIPSLVLTELSTYLSSNQLLRSWAAFLISLFEFSSSFSQREDVKTCEVNTKVAMEVENASMQAEMHAKSLKDTPSFLGLLGL